MFFVHDNNEEKNSFINSNFQSEHGITPPTKYIKKRKFRKITPERVIIYLLL